MDYMFNTAKNMILINAYRQLDNPAGGHRSTNVEFIRQALNEVNNIFSSLKTPTPDILLCGDLIYHGQMGVLKLRATGDEQKMIKHLLDIVDELYLKQHIDKPTHRS